MKNLNFGENLGFDGLVSTTGFDGLASSALMAITWQVARFGGGGSASVSYHDMELATVLSGNETPIAIGQVVGQLEARSGSCSGRSHVSGNSLTSVGRELLEFGNDCLASTSRRNAFMRDTHSSVIAYDSTIAIVHLGTQYELTLLTSGSWEVVECDQLLGTRKHSASYVAFEGSDGSIADVCAIDGRCSDNDYIVTVLNKYMSSVRQAIYEMAA